MKEECEKLNQWTDAKGGAIISGHQYVEIEKTAEKQILKCEKCGKESIGYYN